MTPKPLSRRTALVRRKPLARGKTELRRRARIAPINRARRAALHERQYGPAGYADWIRSLGCVITGCRDARVEAAHVRSRGAGGDWRSLVPLCHEHHASCHALGARTFERRHGVDLADLAAAHVLRWRAFSGEGLLDGAHPLLPEQQPAQGRVVAHPRVHDVPQGRPDVLHFPSSPSRAG